LACRGGEGEGRIEAAGLLLIWSPTILHPELEYGSKFGLPLCRRSRGDGVHPEEGCSLRPAPAPPHAALRRAHHATAWIAAVFFPGRWNGQSMRQNGAILNLQYGGPLLGDPPEFSPACGQVVRPRRYAGGRRRLLVEKIKDWIAFRFCFPRSFVLFARTSMLFCFTCFVLHVICLHHLIYNVQPWILRDPPLVKKK
jgi:hypothetical protein